MSDTIPIRYIGQKDVHEDSLYGTGLRWKRGAKHNVPRQIASYMLSHPDVYADARLAAVREKDPIKPERPVISGRDIHSEVPLANLANMTKAQIASYNEISFGERIDPEKMSLSQMREHVRMNMRERG